MMHISSAEFVISSADSKKCPQSNMPEFAFIGRSNVGKSSLINMLVNRKDLAMTSSKPGKTLLINHFLINDSWFLVDLPGYGYAKVSKDSREKLRTLNESYILNRVQLTNLFLLIDSRLEPQKIDIDFITWLGENGIPFSIVFTKIDKLSKLQMTNNLKAYKEKLEEFWEKLPPIFSTSSEKGTGREPLLDYIENILQEIKK